MKKLLTAIALTIATTTALGASQVLSDEFVLIDDCRLLHEQMVAQSGLETDIIAVTSNTLVVRFCKPNSSILLSCMNNRAKVIQSTSRGGCN